MSRMAVGTGFLVFAIWITRHLSHRNRVANLSPGASLLSYQDLKVVPNAGIGHLGRVRGDLERLGKAAQVDAVAIINLVLSAAYSVQASDLHISPDRHLVKIQFRVGGVLHDVGVLGSHTKNALVNRVKVLAKLSLHNKHTPQDGSISFDGDELQLRVSTLPTSHGEKVVIRLAISDEARYDLDRIGFSPDVLVLLKTVLARTDGVVYITGPTGSGKTTTMYASMVHVRNTRGDRANLVTLEDPIEVDLTGISQTQIENETGLTFATGLRSMLRQDPDVIMVGEIRDEETAQTALRAGMTGHLLLTSVHSDSSVGVFGRLRQLNVENFQLASASVAVVNQRLALRNCPGCTAPTPLDDTQKRQLELFGVDPEGLTFYAGAGCAHCGGKGREGRLPLIEVLPVTNRLRDMLLDSAASHQLMEAAIEEGMKTLGMQALERASQAEIPVDEVIRVLSIK